TRSKRDWSSDVCSSDLVSPAGSYIQYRARLFTPSPAAPVLHDISIDFQHFAPSAVLVTEPFLPADLATWGRVDLNTSGPQGTHEIGRASGRQRGQAPDG